MDLQIKLVDDGYGAGLQVARSGGAAGVGDWKDKAYGTTFEPAVVRLQQAPGRRRRSPADPRRPRQAAHHQARQVQGQGHHLRHREVRRRLHVHHAGHARTTRSSGTWPRPSARPSVRVQSSTGTMLERISSGENLLGYNVLGSYALVRAKKDPSIGIVLPKDYTLVLSRVMFISKTRQEPERRQAVARLHAVQARPDRASPTSRSCTRSAPTSTARPPSAELTKQLGERASSRCRSAPTLLQYLDQTKRLAFLKQWKEAAGKK